MRKKVRNYQTPNAKLQTPKANPPNARTFKSPYITRYGALVKPYQIQDTIRCYKILQDTFRFFFMLQDATRCFQIL